ncbi:MAG TPA: iron-sulfur cluster repair protein YtfE [Planctomycetes bacterium]|nr:iron-sulfur cluster repair protein YtfE [Planctomycetota bacterium]
MSTTDALSPETTLADLATKHTAASRVFHAHGLDFCCHGQIPLSQACTAANLDPNAILDEIRAATRSDEPSESWDERPLPELIDHILTAYHEDHRSELPRLIEMAEKVERVHAEKPTCPAGLAANLHAIQADLDMHMMKEEEILFPLIRSGRGQMAGGPIQVMEREHEDVARLLERQRELTSNYNPPEEACNTWRALFLGCKDLERALMEHIHLENNVLFPRALRG